MYAAIVDSTRHTFQASGSLWQDALVMQDLESKTLWSQISGKAIMGDKEGSKLELYPSQQMTFTEFSSRFPNGLLLAKGTKGLPNSNYASYFADLTKLGIFGRVDKYRRLRGKDKVVGIRIDNQQAALAMKLLRRKGMVVVDKFEPPIVVTHNDSTGSISAFSLGSLPSDMRKKLKFKDGRIIVKKTDVAFDPVTGVIVSGEGDNLESLPFTTAYWFAWVSFFPDTKLMK